MNEQRAEQERGNQISGSSANRGPRSVILDDLRAMPPSAAESLKQRSGIGIAIGLGLNEVDHRLFDMSAPRLTALADWCHWMVFVPFEAW